MTGEPTAFAGAAPALSGAAVSEPRAGGNRGGGSRGRANRSRGAGRVHVHRGAALAREVDIAGFVNGVYKEKFEDRLVGEQEDLEPVYVMVGCKSDLEELRQVRDLHIRIMIRKDSI